jgi:hypothetical protein
MWRVIIVTGYLKAAAFLIVGACVGYLIAYMSGLAPSYIPLISAGIGLFVAFAIPIWQALFFNVPKLAIEISAITRSVSEFAAISIDDYPELEVLQADRETPSYPLLFPHFIVDDADGPTTAVREREPSSGFKIRDVERLVARAKQQLKDLPEQINERRKEVDRLKSLTPNTFTKYDCEQLNRPLSPEVEFDADDKEGNLSSLRAQYQKRLEQAEKRYADLQGGLPTAERKLELLRSELVDNRSLFTVSASLINSGRTNTAIKVPALLRVSIGEGNYIDIKLTLKDFENKSEISANGTRIVVFVSPEISGFPEEDRKLIKTYWGQSVSARLYLEDIHETPYGSNRIAFAEGLYQKIIYDRLSQFATADNPKKGR